MPCGTADICLLCDTADMSGARHIDQLMYVYTWIYIYIHEYIYIYIYIYMNVCVTSSAEVASFSCNGGGLDCAWRILDFVWESRICEKTGALHTSDQL